MINFKSLDPLRIENVKLFIDTEKLYSCIYCSINELELYMRKSGFIFELKEKEIDCEDLLLELYDNDKNFTFIKELSREIKNGCFLNKVPSDLDITSWICELNLV